MRQIKKSKWTAVLTALLLCMTAAGCGEKMNNGQESPEEVLQTAQSETAADNETEADSRAADSEDLQESSVIASESESEEEEEDTSYDFTVCFAGDINLYDKWCTTLFMDRQENGIYDCISPELMEEMNAADIMCLNNEFTYSDRGTPMAGKAYTFRANPKRVEVLKQMGVDVVTLANNHVYDYGADALADTFDTLQDAGIPYFGAGRDLTEAMQPVYMEVQGKVIAFVGASRAEKNKMTPQAAEDKAGILRCYEPELFLQVIEQARQNADFVIAYVHWGTEYSTKLEAAQLETGKAYLDAGADAVIGAHSHCLQGMEYYDNKPIVYSLGNYWFNERTLDTMLVKLHFSGDKDTSELSLQVVPAVQAGYKTTYASDEKEQRRIYDYLESISVNISIDDAGLVLENEASGQ